MSLRLIKISELRKKNKYNRTKTATKIVLKLMTRKIRASQKYTPLGMSVVA